MSNIPGLSVCPVEEGISGISLPTFDGKKIFIPESHRYGHCRPLDEFEKYNFKEGRYGVIYKCRDLKSNENFALKVFKITEEQQVEGIPSSVLREINILKTLKHHPNLISSYGTVAGKELFRNYLILDYCDFTLKELIEENVEAIFDKAMVKFFMYHILLGLEYIHGGLIIHRNICSKNIMFTNEGVLKIGGFRASRFYNRGNMTPGITELNYRAPELLIQATMYGPAVDMWSTGCVFAELLLRKPLFSGNSELELLKSIFRILGTPSEAIWPGFRELFSKMEIGGRTFEVTSEKPYSDLTRFFAFETVACRDLVQNLIVYFPNARFSAQECLASPYFAEKPESAKSEDLVKVLRSLKPAKALRSLKPAAASSKMEI